VGKVTDLGARGECFGCFSVQCGPNPNPTSAL
jgi:hypothetical protein